VIDAPIHEFLWKLTLPAVRAAWSAGQALINDGKPVSRVAVPEYEESNAGWPMVVATSSVFAPKTAPVKWRSMFSVKPSQFGDLVVVGDVPELSAALEAVRARSQDDQFFARGMNAFADKAAMPCDTAASSGSICHSSALSSDALWRPMRRRTRTSSRFTCSSSVGDLRLN